MRRRTFLLTTATAGAAVIALPGLVFLSHSRPKQPTPTPPPSPDAVPSGFNAIPVWPDLHLRTDTVITAARNRYLCGAATVKETRNTFTAGWCPVVVDVSGPTTRAVLMNPDDPDSTWTTQTVELDDPGNKKDDPNIRPDHNRDRPRPPRRRTRLPHPRHQHAVGALTNLTAPERRDDR